MPVHLVSSIDTSDFGAPTVRIGDLNGDGAPDLLFIQSEFPVRNITCLTATTIHGERLWQTGVPSGDHGKIGSDLPVQVYDWDNDGANEVIYIRQAERLVPTDDFMEDIERDEEKTYRGNATLVVLDGKSGKEKTSFAIPSKANDSIAFADLTGRGRREDFVVKDRYWNVWGISWEGAMLWHWRGHPGHYPAIADVDGDGKDELFFGYTLLDHDGKVLFDGYPIEDKSEYHSDANFITRLPNGEWRLLFGNHGVHCLAVDGKELWYHELQEAQHVVVEKFRADSPLQAAVIDRGFPRTPQGRPADLYLYDLESGKELWRRRQPAGSWGTECMDIRWTVVEDRREILVKNGNLHTDRVYDGNGDILDEILPPPEICGIQEAQTGLLKNPGIHYVYRADLWSDSREEIILVGPKGVRIYANVRPLAVPALYNCTLYHGK